MRFLARFTSFAALAAAVVVATIDSIRFVATSLLEPVTLKVVLAWSGIGPERLSGLLGDFDNGLLGVVTAQPAAFVFLVLSLLFWMAGYRRPRPFKPFATTGA